jgi:hypothetical protein
MKLAVGVLTVAICLASATQDDGSVSFLVSNQSPAPSLWSHFLCKVSLALTQLSNDHSNKDNEGYEDLTKLLVASVVSALICLSVLGAVQGILALVLSMQSKRCRYDLVRLRKNYNNLQRTSQLAVEQQASS